MKSKLLKGSLLILLGASCYGMLGIYVKMAYEEGYSTAEVTLAQFGLGFLTLLLLNNFYKIRIKTREIPVTIKSKLRLILSGTSLGLTSIFYYLAVNYIPVSVGIVLLIQAVWTGVLLEMIITRKFCGWRKFTSVIVVIIGSILATNLFLNSIIINWTGISWGFLAALSYTATMYSAKNVEPQLPAHKRSLYMILGGLLIIVIVFHSAINLTFSYNIFYSWGLLIALFGTILPPLLFTAGMPLTGVGLGAILASVEIPIAVIGAHLLLKEDVSPYQWLGVIIIIISVVLMHFKRVKRTL